jgi:hypothetical protein
MSASLSNVKNGKCFLNRGMLYPYQPVGAYRCVKMLGIEKL